MGKANHMTFPGGVHPADGSDKALSADRPIQPYMPKQVAISMEQTIGGTCELLVKPGDRVKAGQKIGEAKAFMAANIHASVDGRVLEVKNLNQNGRTVQVCVIQADDGPAEEAEALSYTTSLADISGWDRDGIIQKIQEGGLAGMGGAGFPAYKKYLTDKKIDTLLINGVECEPYLTCDYRSMLEYSYAIVNGVRLLWKAAGAERACICIEDNKPKAIERLREIVKEVKEPLEVVVLPTRYPQGGERQLIQAVMGREVPQGGLPADVGAIVSNIGSAKAAADMVLGDLPLIRRVVTVTGSVKNPGNFLVPIGTSVRELLELSGGVTAVQNRVILGGPMTGPCIASDWTPESGGELPFVSKTTSGVLVLPESRIVEQPCMRCEGCVRVCPAGLKPYQIDCAFMEEDYDLCEKLYASECIACGCCSYTCPAKRELSFRVRSARDMVKQRQRERAVKQ